MEKYIAEILVLATVAIITAVIQYMVSKNRDKKQRRHEVFSDYSKRYTHLISSMLEETHAFSSNFDQNNPKLRKYISEFFMLIREEYYLHSDDLIEDKIWGIWSSGVEHHMNNPFFSQGWEFVQKQVDMTGKFKDFIDSKNINNSSLDIAA